VEVCEALAVAADSRNLRCSSRNCTGHYVSVHNEVHTGRGDIHAAKGAELQPAPRPESWAKKLIRVPVSTACPKFSSPIWTPAAERLQNCKHKARSSRTLTLVSNSNPKTPGATARQNDSIDDRLRVLSTSPITP
jgi:hypothetical protein